MLQKSDQGVHKGLHANAPDPGGGGVDGTSKRYIYDYKFTAVMTQGSTMMSSRSEKMGEGFWITNLPRSVTFYFGGGLINFGVINPLTGNGINPVYVFIIFVCPALNNALVFACILPSPFPAPPTRLLRRTRFVENSKNICISPIRLGNPPHQ